MTQDKLYHMPSLQAAPIIFQIPRLYENVELFPASPLSIDQGFLNLESTNHWHTTNEFELQVNFYV